MPETASTYTPDVAAETVSRHVVVPSEWSEIEETRSLAFVYALVAFLLGIIALVWLAVYCLG